MPPFVSRFVCLAALLAGGASTPLSAQSTASAVLTQPSTVYKLREHGRENTESWLFHLAVDVTGDTQRVIGMTIRSASRGGVRETRVVSEAGIASLGAGQIRRPNSPTGAPLATPQIYQAFRIRGSAPVGAEVERLEIDVELRDTANRVTHRIATIPILSYTPKTSLIFPFVGNGLVTNAQANDGGHANRSGQFALDVLGLSELYAPQASLSDDNAAYAGWGRTIVAPAAGVVVRARSDRPDQPVPGKSDPAFYATEYAAGGDVGNHVVIDHGNGEFSLIAHMRARSVRVAVGDTVRQGQTLGELGNSGDSFGPHVHYQLQTGPNWVSADALPVRFTNTSVNDLARGVFFKARARP